jgi:hypothetical protein
MDKEIYMGREMYFQPRIFNGTQQKIIHHHQLHLDWHGVTVPEFFNLFENL